MAEIFVNTIIRLEHLDKTSMELRSEHSRQRVSVTFTYEQPRSLTGDENSDEVRSVSLLWKNFEGAEVEYKRLHPGDNYSVNTFLTHPWVLGPSSQPLFFHWPNGDLRPFFEAEQFAESLEEGLDWEERDWSQRFLQGEGELVVSISSYHQPPSLRGRALELLASVPGVNKDNVKELHLPRVLMKDLSEYLQQA